jgi:hypothetical protein
VAEVAALVLQITTSDLTSVGLAAPARPALPLHVEKLPAKARLAALQAFISAFQYNHTPSNYFNLLKRRPFARVMDTAKDIVRASTSTRHVHAPRPAAHGAGLRVRAAAFRWLCRRAAQRAVLPC